MRRQNRSPFLAVLTSIATTALLSAFSPASPASAEPPTTGSNKHFARVNVAPGGKQARGGSMDVPVAISGNGRFVVFGTLADNILGDGTSLSPRLYLKDTLTGEVVAVRSALEQQGINPEWSARLSDDGRIVAIGRMGNGPGISIWDRATDTLSVVGATPGDYGMGGVWPSLSADGRYVAYERRIDSLQSGVYRHDRLLGTTELVSAAADGQPATGENAMAEISGDGHVVVFGSSSPELTGHTNPSRFLLAKDMRTGVVTNLTAPSADYPTGITGIHRGISVSGDGTKIAFATFNLSWDGGGTVEELVDYYFHDRTTGTTRRFAQAGAGHFNFFRQWSEYFTAISGDGKTVLFTSSERLVSEDSNGLRDIYAYDVETRAFRLISAGPRQADYASHWPAISRDGRVAAFASEATTLVKGDSNGLTDVFTADLHTGEIARASTTSIGEQVEGQTSTTWRPSISDDGRVVTFTSRSTNLTAHDLSGAAGQYVYDRKRGRMRLVNVGPTGHIPEAGMGGRLAELSDDGKRLAIFAAGLVEKNTPLVVAVLEHGTFLAIDPPVPGAGYGDIALSGDGRTLAVTVSQWREGTDEVVGHLFGCDVDANTCELLAPPLGETSAQGFSDRPALSANGRRVVFLSDAKNLAPGVTDGLMSVFLYDRDTRTTTRVSVSPNGEALADAGYHRPAISRDGQVVAFVGRDPGTGLLHTYVRYLAEPTTVDLTKKAGTLASASAPSLSRDGRVVAFGETTNTGNRILLYDRTTDEVSLALPQTLNGTVEHPVLSADGKHLVFVSTASNLVADDTNRAADVFVLDLNPTLSIETVWPPAIDDDLPTKITIKGSGFKPGGAAPNALAAAPVPVVRVGAFVATDVEVIDDKTITAVIPAGAGTGALDIVVDFGDGETLAEMPVGLTRVDTGTLGDVDGDGLPDGYEIALGLDATVGDSASDPDGDGRTTAQEYAEGTHPTGGVVQGYLAEGATTIFEDRLALLNTDVSNARVLVTAQKGDGSRVSHAVSIGPLTRATIDMGQVPGLADAEFATVVSSTGRLVIDRTMTWAGGQGSHAETAIAQPASTWYFAEGATHSGFQLFYLVQNPGAETAHVEVQFLRPAPLPPVIRAYDVAPTSRFTIWANLDGELAATDLSAVVRSDRPVIAERAMYRDAQGVVFGAGHEGAGVTAPATQWFLAEGATGPYFDLFVLIGNPNASPAACDVTFLLPDGSRLSRPTPVPATTRANIWVDAEGGRLADTAVSTTVSCDVPVVVERAMWWPGSADTWTEAHDSAGSTSSGVKWALAEGEQGSATSAETYILVANTSPFAGAARVTLYFEDGSSVSQEVALRANSRTNVAVGAPADLGGFGDRVMGKRFGAVVESLDTGAGLPQVVVERAMYSSAGGVTWAAGTNALATKLQ